MKNSLKGMLGIAAMMLATPFSAWADIQWPSEDGKYFTLPNEADINFNDCAMRDPETSWGVFENDGASLGSTGPNTNVRIFINNTEEQAYTFSMKSGANGLEAVTNLSMVDVAGDVYMDHDFDIPNTGGWGASTDHSAPTMVMPAGKYCLTFSVKSTTGSYAGNYYNFHLAPLGKFIDIPGELTWEDIVCTGGCKWEGNGSNIGYMRHGVGFTINMNVKEAGVYNLSYDVTWFANKTHVVADVIDIATGETEYSTWLNVTGSHHYDHHLLMSTGLKQVKFTFTNPNIGTSWLYNVPMPKFEKVGEKVAILQDFIPEGVEAGEFEGYDFNVNLPISYESKEFVFTVPALNGTLDVTAKEGDNDVTVTSLGNGRFSIPTPALDGSSVIRIKLNPDADAVVDRTEFLVRVFHIGAIDIKSLVIDGTDMDADFLALLNQKGEKVELSFPDYVLTTIPSLHGEYVHGDKLAATGVLENGAVTFNFKAETGGLSKEYVLSFPGYHSYTPGANDETEEIKFDGNRPSGSDWTNGIYTISAVNDGYQSWFKGGKGEHQLSIPANYVVKQLIFRDLKNNYAGNIARITDVKSEGATVIAPTLSGFQHENVKLVNLVYNFENHVAGTPVSFTFEGGGQMMWSFELTVEKQALTGAPTLESIEIVAPEGTNHFVAIAKYDRVIKKAKASVDTISVNGTAGAPTVYFPVTDLDYSTKYTLTIAAGDVEDEYGNKTAETVTKDIEIGAKATVAKTLPVVVSTVDELRSAAANISGKVVLVLNGDYDLGAEALDIRGEGYSVVGQSKEGVLIHGKRSGISNPVLSTRYSTDIYLQDITLRNDYDWDVKERGGVGVALGSGTREIAYNVSLQSQQDTQVTNGTDGYYENCDIYGAVDFICGGGNQFYKECNLIMTNPGHITAPSTGTGHLWGYVFESCVIDAYNGSYTFEPDSKGNTYNLGRPWQNEPRAYFLRTRMNLKPNDAGWGSMGDLVTHFYEYGSVDSEGNLIDLSVRTNSPTHKGEPYTPVLTDEEATMFTLSNVIGLKESFVPTDYTRQLSAPEATVADDRISWADMSDALYYVITSDGAFIGVTTDAHFTPEANGTYCVQAANVKGGLSPMSAPVTFVTTGIYGINPDNAEGNVEYFNIQGQRVHESSKGILIRVTTDAEGNVKAEKIVR